MIFIVTKRQKTAISQDSSSNGEIATKNATQSELQEKNTTESQKYNVIYPDGSECVYFPMLEFEGPVKTKINEIDLIHLAIDKDRQSGLKHVTTFYFFSPPGLGKTVMGGHLARVFNCPYQIINCVSSMIDLDLLGSQILVGEETKWQDGPLTSIIRATNDYGFGILLINELNALTVNAQMALNPLLDRQEGVILTQNNNEYVRILPDSHLLVLVTMNPDVIGINELQDSVRDRASAIIQMGYPLPDKEAKIVHLLTGIPEDWAQKYTEVIAECRSAKLIDKTVTKAPSTRALIDWVTYTPVWGPLTAFELTIANRYAAGINTEEKEILLSIARGKGVAKWDIPSTFTPSPEKIKEIQAISESLYIEKLATITKMVDKKYIPPQMKKKIQKKELAQRLHLKSLDGFQKKPEIPPEIVKDPDTENSPSK